GNGRRIRRRCAGDRFIQLGGEIVTARATDGAGEDVRLAGGDEPPGYRRVIGNVVGGPASYVHVSVADADAVLGNDDRRAAGADHVQGRRGQPPADQQDQSDDETEGGFHVSASSGRNDHTVKAREGA